MSNDIIERVRLCLRSPGPTKPEDYTSDHADLDGQIIRAYRDRLWESTPVLTPYLDDLQAVAREYLRFTDPAPITEAWLVEMGFVRDVWFFDFGRIAIKKHHGEWCAFLDSRIAIATITTRGQLACLMRGLGITLDAGEAARED